VHLHVHLHAIAATPTWEAQVILDIAIIAVGVLVFVVPELVSVLRRARRARRSAGCGLPLVRLPDPAPTVSHRGTPRG
jgi:hypothetical protein